jgi:pyruvate dehydrogenase E2 component (dihydrolipoamide acetyltransferase)
MPQMGESIFEGTITKWLKQVGEKVSRDEPLFEISTDKVDSEIPAPAEGVLAEILIPAGKTVQINTVVALIESESAIADATPAAAEPAPTAVLKSEAETPGPAELGTVKAPAEDIKKEPAAAQTVPPVPGISKPAGAETQVQAQDIRTSPLVRRLAREHNIDLSKVIGTGLGGRITREDVLGFVEKRDKPAVVMPAAIAEQSIPAGAEPAETQAATPTSTPEPVRSAQAVGDQPRFIGESEMAPMSPMRKAIAERMVLSRHTSAHVSTVFEVDMSPIVSVRLRHKDDFEKREGVKLSYTPFFVKALVDTVREFPVFNASVSGESIVFKKSINVGIAVALENGLIVPVVKDAHLKSFTGLVLAINDLAERARTKRLKPEDVQNGTISITNPGIYGSLFGTPIINQPQVAILGIGGIEKRPIVIHDAIAIRSMVYLSLSFDHRIIDGAIADQFMARMKAMLEGWSGWIE